jgi:hypothetical protein
VRVGQAGFRPDPARVQPRQLGAQIAGDHGQFAGARLQRRQPLAQDRRLPRRADARGLVFVVQGGDLAQGEAERLGHADQPRGLQVGGAELLVRVGPAAPAGARAQQAGAHVKPHRIRRQAGGPREVRNLHRRLTLE